MERKTSLTVGVLACIGFLISDPAWADVPAPPANQSIGMDDIAFGDVVEADCRVCHDSGVPDRHHGLYNSLVPSLSVVPYPQFNTDDGAGGFLYSCMSCHSDTFILERDCLACHDGSSPHHQTALADAGDCKACHGDLVDNMGDGHYIPAYAPSLVTPTRSQGDADQTNSYGSGAGACNYCHDQDVMPPGTPELILDNHDLHHGINLVDFGSRCNWCHDFGLPFDEQIRVCEGCHGPDSLHNIQVDSPNTANIGTVVVGGEDAGYGHVGRDAGPNDSDCWGCHGFAGVASAPFSGPIIPTVLAADKNVIDAGKDTAVTLIGSSFSNIAGNDVYLSSVALTAADGSTVSLKPDKLSDGALTVTIPGDTPAGNYNVQAVKDEFASNPAVLSIVPEVAVTSARGSRRGTVVVMGSGFGGHAAGSGTSVTTTTRAGSRRDRTTTTEEARIISWTENRIVCVFSKKPSRITVNSVFGKDTSQVR